VCIDFCRTVTRTTLACSSRRRRFCERVLGDVTNTPPTRAVKVKDRELDPAIREVLREARRSLAPYGWRVTVERAGKSLSFEFRNPLSPILLGLGLGANPERGELRQTLQRFLKDEDEFSRVQSARPPRNKRRLLGALRGGSAHNEWSPETFSQVIDLLYEARVIVRSEFDWLTTVGPAVYPSWLSSPSSGRRSGGIEADSTSD
jgi:hypothetical protein